MSRPAEEPLAAQRGSGTPGLPAWPVFDDEQRAAVDAVLKNGRVNAWTGEVVRQFETEYAAFLKVPHALAVSNGTLALELALRSLNIREGHEVIVPSRTFIATASSVALCGATPVFADVDPTSGNVTASAIEPLISPRTRAIIVVHLAGWPCEMDTIRDLCRRRRLPLIEDCAQAHGATYRNQQVGSMGDIACFSFSHDKILTTGGEGGLIATHRDDLHKKLWSLRDHGKDQDAVLHRTHPSLTTSLHDSQGTNARLTEMQAAIGRIQLQRLPQWVACRQALASILDRELKGIPGLKVITPPAHVSHAYYKYTLQVEPSGLSQGWTRDRLAMALQTKGIPCGPGSCSEVYLEKAMTPYAPKHRRAAARQLGESTLTLLVHPALEDKHVTGMAREIQAICQQTACQPLPNAA